MEKIKLNPWFNQPAFIVYLLCATITGTFKEIVAKPSNSLHLIQSEDQSSYRDPEGPWDLSSTSLHSSYNDVLSICLTHLACFLLRILAHVLPATWKALVSNVYVAWPFFPSGFLLKYNLGKVFPGHISKVAALLCASKCFPPFCCLP